MKIYRYIAALLLLCFSAFLIHNLVPHHHHSEVFQSPIASDCPFEHGDNQEHKHDKEADTDAQEHPKHCHAFNDVVFEKNTLTFQNAGAGQIAAMFVPAQGIKLAAPVKPASGPYIFLKLPFKSHSDLGARALRAPPSYA